MPTNLYGPGDNFDLQNSHVLPALIRKFHDAKQSNSAEVTLWGSGAPMREFLHADDLAEACLHLLRTYDGDLAINVGTGVDVTISDLANLVASATGFYGHIRWDATKPDGTPRKLLDVTRLTDAGWVSKISLKDGLERTYSWYREQTLN
jgi:GDP-L-fucose synthase